MNKKFLISGIVILLLTLSTFGFLFVKKEIGINRVEKEIQKNSDTNLFFDIDTCSQQKEEIISGAVDGADLGYLQITTSQGEKVSIFTRPQTLFVEQVVDGQGEILEYNKIELKNINKNDSVVIVSIPQGEKKYIGMVIKKLIFK